MSIVGSWYYYIAVYLAGIFGAVVWFYINKPKYKLSSRIVCAMAICAITAFIAALFCQIFLNDYLSNASMFLVSMLLSVGASYRFHVVVDGWWDNEKDDSSGN